MNKYKILSIRLNIDTDKDILDYLKMFSKNHLSGAIKSIIREKISSSFNSLPPHIDVKIPVKTQINNTVKSTEHIKVAKADKKELLNNILSNDF